MRAYFRLQILLEDLWCSHFDARLLSREIRNQSSGILKQCNLLYPNWFIYKFWYCKHEQLTACTFNLMIYIRVSLHWDSVVFRALCMWNYFSAALNFFSSFDLITHYQVFCFFRTHGSFKTENLLIFHTFRSHSSFPVNFNHETFKSSASKIIEIFSIIKSQTVFQLQWK